MLRTIRSKFQIQEQRIIIKKVIMKSGKNITEDRCKIYIELISFFRDEPRKTKRIPTSVWVQPKNWNSKKDDGTVNNKDPEALTTLRRNMFYYLNIRLSGHLPCQSELIRSGQGVGFFQYDFVTRGFCFTRDFLDPASRVGAVFFY